MYTNAAFVLLIAACVDGSGIVIKSLPKGNVWPPDLLNGPPEYTHHMECDYRYKYPGDWSGWTYTMDLHCEDVKESGKTIYQLSINFDNSVLDIIQVTSCDMEGVVNSVFPLKQKAVYPPEDQPDHRGRPEITYLKYITTDGECFAKKYKYRNRAATAAYRYDPEKIQCEGEPGPKPWTTYGEVAQFTNCKVNKLPLSGIVKDYLLSKPAWRPNDTEGKKHKKLLRCTFDQFSALYELICVRGDKKGEYFAFVTYDGDLLDRFTVKSCKEDGIVNGIFTIKDTTANSKSKIWPWIETIWFSKEDGNCYKREYTTYDFSTEATSEPCPTTPDQWTNPTWGKMGMWRECDGPMSVKKSRIPGEPVEEDSDSSDTSSSAPPSGLPEDAIKDIWEVTEARPISIS